MIISQIIWPLSFVYPSENKMNPVETNIIRSIFTMLSHFWLIRYFDLNFSLKSSSNLNINLRRNFIICLHQFTLTASLFVLPFPIVFTLNSSCVLFVFILDYFIFNVEINKQQVQGVVLGFIGVLLTVNG
jgi:drug/metabolite transporter (DMT)-like permease